MNPTKKTTEPNESRKWSILLGIAVVARVVIGVATKEDPFLILANLLVLFFLGKAASRAFLRSNDELRLTGSAKSTSTAYSEAEQ